MEPSADNNHQNHPSPHKQRLGSIRTTAADLVLGFIFLTITGLYALLMIGDTVPQTGLIILGGLWLIHWLLSGRLSFSTPLDMPILGLCILLPISLTISVDWTLSLPKVYGLVLGVAFFYVLVNAVHSYLRLPAVIFSLIFLALAVSILGLVGSDWTWGTGSILPISQIYTRLPHLINYVPRSTYSGINVNTTGGALTFFLPLLVSMLLDGGAFYRKYLVRSNLAAIKGIVFKLVVLFVLILVSGTLLLTQSRGAYLGSIIGLLVLAVWKDSRFLWAVPVLLAGIFAIFMVYSGGSITEIINLLDTNQYETLPGRLEAWRNTIHLIRDFPFTGAGIGTYSMLFKEVYTFIPFRLQGTGSYHAHNTFLAVAIDLGIPALVLYAALLSSSISMVWDTLKPVRSIVRVLLVGLACGLLAHQVFGLTDAYLLGTKLGVIMWIFYGLITAIFVHKEHFRWKVSRTVIGNPGLLDQKAAWREVKRHTQELLLGFAGWVLAALAAISFININPNISLVIAVLGGFLLGIFLVRNFKPGSS